MACLDFVIFNNESGESEPLSKAVAEEAHERG